MRKIEKGNVIFRENESFNNLMYVLYQGEVLVFKNTQVDQILVDNQLQESFNDSVNSQKNDNVANTQQTRKSIKRKLTKQPSIALKITEAEISRASFKRSTFTPNKFKEVQAPTSISEQEQLKPSSMAEFVNDKFSILKAKRNSISLVAENLSEFEVNRFSKRYGEPIRIMQAPEAIGEISFLQLKPRTATIVTNTLCQLITLKKSDFQELISAYEKANQMKRKLLGTAFGFRKIFSSNVFDNFFFSFSQKTLSKNQKITTEGEEGKYVYVITEGSVSVLKGNNKICVISKGELLGEELLFEQNNYFFDSKVLSANASFFLAPAAILEVKIPREIKNDLLLKFENKIQSREYLEQKSRKSQDFTEALISQLKNGNLENTPSSNPFSNNELLASYFVIGSKVNVKETLMKEYKTVNMKNANCRNVSMFQTDRRSSYLISKFRAEKSQKSISTHIRINTSDSKPPFRIRRELNQKFQSFSKSGKLKDLPDLKSCILKRKESFNFKKKAQTDRLGTESQYYTQSQNSNVFFITDKKVFLEDSYNSLKKKVDSLRSSFN